MQSLLFSAIVDFCDTPTSKNIETFKLPGKVLRKLQELSGSASTGYHDDKNLDRQYPVFYFNDGLMVFDSQGPGLRIEELVFDLYKKNSSLPQIIVVGIDNGACTDKTTNELVQIVRMNFFHILMQVFRLIIFTSRNHPILRAKNILIS